MAKEDERPQFNPKHRIAGAIILVSLAVIFIPMLLDETEPPAENESLTQIPPRDSVPAETKVVVTPLSPATEPATSASGAGTPPEKPIVEKSTPAAPAQPPVAKVDDPPAPVAPSEKKADTTGAVKPVEPKPNEVARGWAVQVGTFANTDNADRLRDKLKVLGYSVKSETVTVRGSKAVRLQVGPYRDKSDASKVQAKLHKELNINGLVRAYP